MNFIFAIAPNVCANDGCDKPFVISTNANNLRSFSKFCNSHFVCPFRISFTFRSASAWMAPLTVIGGNHSPLTNACVPEFVVAVTFMVYTS